MRALLLLIFLSIIGCVRPNQGVQQTAGESYPTECPSYRQALNASPQSIEEAISLLNSLPKPLELRCFIKALERPLYVSATSSTLSIQRADGQSSPRIFIFKGDLVMAIKADGDGTYLLEFSELLSDMRSIKGEVELPLYGDTSLSKAFSHIDRQGKTSCSACHLAEREEGVAPDGTKIYSSYALRPTEAQTIALADLRQEHYNCELQNTFSRRCSVFKELFENGEVLEKDFPQGAPTMMETFSF